MCGLSGRRRTWRHSDKLIFLSFMKSIHSVYFHGRLVVIVLNFFPHLWGNSMIVFRVASEYLNLLSWRSYFFERWEFSDFAIMTIRWDSDFFIEVVAYEEITLDAHKPVYASGKISLISARSLHCINNYHHWPGVLIIIKIKPHTWHTHIRQQYGELSRVKKISLRIATGV